MKVRRVASPQLEGVSMLPGYAGRYYGAGAFPQGNVNLGGAPRPQPQAAPAPQVQQTNLGGAPGPQVQAAPAPQVQQAMPPLGQTRPLLAYGLPAAAGLAVGGMLYNQGESPGTAAIGGAAAALGARGGLGAARLAGQYAPFLTDTARSAIVPAGKALVEAAGKVPAGGKRMKALEGGADILRNLYQGAGQITPGMVQKTAAVGAVPLAAGLAGLGGVAAGAIPSAIGVPGFQAQMPINPEAYGSSNAQSIYPTTMQLS